MSKNTPQDEKRMELEAQLKSLPPSTEKLKIYNALILHLYNSHPKDALVYAKEAFKLADELEDWECKVATYCYTTYTHFGMGDLKAARKYAGNGKRLANKIKFIEGVHKLNTALVLILHREGRYQEARLLSEDNVIFFEQTKDINNLAAAWANIGITYYEESKYETAIRCFIKALKYFDENEIGYQPHTSYHNIAASHYYLHDFEKAKEYNELALKFAQKLGDKEYEAEAYHIDGLIQHKIGNIDSAIKSNLKSINIFQKTENKPRLSMAYTDLAAILRTKKKFKEAIIAHQKAIALAKETDTKECLMNAYFSYGVTKKIMGELQQAKSLLHKAQRISEEIGNLKEAVTIYQELADVYELIEDATSALKYHKLYTNQALKVASVAQRKAIEELEVHFELEKKDELLKVALERNKIIEKQHRELVRKVENYKKPKEFFLNVKNAPNKIVADNICYCKSEGNYVRIVFENKPLLPIRRTLKSMTELLPDNFLKIHQAYIVNMDKVVKVERTYESLSLKNGIELSVSRSHRKTLKAYLNNGK